MTARSLHPRSALPGPFDGTQGTTPVVAVPNRDIRHHYHGYWTLGGVCRIRVYERHGCRPVVLATELPENENTSITNLAEQVAAEVMSYYLGGRRPVWIEHYPVRRFRPETFHLVDFKHYEPEPQFSCGRLVSVKIGAPTWRRLSEEEVMRLIGGMPE